MADSPEKFAKVFRAANTVVRPLLRSRLHGVLRGRLMLLDYTGGKTGRRYSFPVGYFSWDGGDVLAQREGERVTWSGRFRPPLADAQIPPRPVQPRLPVWLGVGGSPGSAVRAGTLGLPMVLGLIGGTFASAAPVVELYRQAGVAAGAGPSARTISRR